MQEYKTITKTYETEVISKCICDKCGEECENLKDDGMGDLRTIVRVTPQYIVDTSIRLDLCPNCTKELMNWFPRNEEIQEFLDTVELLEDI